MFEREISIEADGIGCARRAPIKLIADGAPPAKEAAAAGSCVDS